MFLTVGVKYPHRVLGANRTACHALGLTARELIGQSLSSFAAPEEIASLHRFIGRLERAEQMTATEIRMVRRQPPVRFFARLQAVRVLHDDDDEEDHFLAAVTDVSDLVRARDVLQQDRDALEKAVAERTAELERANRELMEKNKELQDFAFIASHDLREPNRKVITFGSLLEERYGEQLDERGLDYLERMKNAAVRMDRMLNSLLDYSRLGSRRLQFEIVDLEEIVRQVGANLAEELTQRQGLLKVGDLPSVEAEPQQMTQLFQNLISNAIKFSARPPEITIYSEGGQRDCRIYVVDNGIGFDPKYIDKIFTPFQRLHAKDAYEGTGMGLTICRKIVEHHRGGITAHGTPGEGSVFIVTLPYRQ